MGFVDKKKNRASRRGEGSQKSHRNVERSKMKKVSARGRAKMRNTG